MSTISIKDYKINNLQRDYEWYSQELYREQRHVTRLFDLEVIGVNEKNQYLKQINDLLRQMNNRYNQKMLEICESDSSDAENDDGDRPLSEVFPLTDLSTRDGEIYDELDYLVGVCRLLDVEMVTKESDDQLFDQPFEDLKKEMVAIAEKIGFYSVDSALETLIGRHYAKLYPSDQLEQLKMFDQLFIPIKHRIVEKATETTLMVEKIDSEYDTLIENVAELSVNTLDHRRQRVILTCLVINDPLNIVVRTSQICHNIVYQKKKAIESQLSNRKDINDKFKKNYLKNASFLDLVGLTEDQFIRRTERDYKKYRKLIGCSFMSLMKEFIKDSIKNMHDVIRLLLYGSDENINVAGLLFGLTKDKKVGNEMVANIIYRHLNYVSQIKLRKTAVNIKNELEKIKSLSVDDVDIKKQIALCKNMPPDVKRVCLEKAEEMKASNNEYYKQQLYVRTLLNYPWPSDEDDSMFRDLGQDRMKTREFLDRLVEKLDQRVYGHKECKNTIKELVGKWFRKPESAGSAIGLVGPPGVGKTLLAKGIGEALGIPFVQITLGGQNDGEILHGHGYTYSSAQPGLVVKRMVEAGKARCVMYFDELDKCSKKQDRNEIQDILIHMTDPNTNDEFSDRFFQEVKFPLDKVIFIFSYNNADNVDDVLLDRMEQIEVKPYSLSDKLNISRNFLMRELSETIGFETGAITIGDGELENLINHYVYEAGVRELKRKLEKIFLKLNIDYIYGEGPFDKIEQLSAEHPVSVTRELVEKYLDKPKSSIEKIHERDLVGVINGLYATSIGKGGIIPIQIFCNHAAADEKFALRLTGSQGKVMKESVVTALTTAMNYLNPDTVLEFVRRNPHGFHIHTPSGATPKDGPSAGAAFATAFISRILDKPIRRQIAMTGENDLQGRVTKIGGLVYKLTGAKKAGVRTVFVSEKNSDDVESIKREHPGIIDDDLEVILVRNLSDILQKAIIDFDPIDLHPKIRLLLNENNDKKVVANAAPVETKKKPEKKKKREKPPKKPA